MAKTRSAPRRRETRQDSTTSTDSVEVDSTVTNNNNNQTKEVKKMAGLTPEQIAALLGASRTKGVYIAKLTEFMNSGEGGVAVAEEWPELAEKQASTVKQGFENAKNSKNAPEGVDNVRVITNEDKVYLVNTNPTVETATEAA